MAQPSRLLLFFLSFLLLLRVASGADNLGQGAECTNSDRCAEGLVCAYNSCFLSSIFNGEIGNGYANACSETNCCPSGLHCWAPEVVLETPLCMQPTNEIRVLKCGGGYQMPGEGPDPTPVPVDPTPQDPEQPPPLPGDGDGEQQQSSTGTTDPMPIPVDPEQPPPEDDEGEVCGNGDSCGPDRLCSANRCHPAAGVNLPNGYGNSCSEDDCCAVGQMCVASERKCGPAVPVLERVTCRGTQPPATGGSPNFEDIWGHLGDGNAAASAGAASVFLLALLASLAMGAMLL